MCTMNELQTLVYSTLVGIKTIAIFLPCRNTTLRRTGIQDLDVERRQVPFFRPFFGRKLRAEDCLTEDSTHSRHHG